MLFRILNRSSVAVPYFRTCGAELAGYGLVVGRGDSAKSFDGGERGAC